MKNMLNTIARDVQSHIHDIENIAEAHAEEWGNPENIYVRVKGHDHEMRGYHLSLGEDGHYHMVYEVQFEGSYLEYDLRIENLRFFELAALSALHPKVTFRLNGEVLYSSVL